MKFESILIALVASSRLVMSSERAEYGTYLNPNPRPFEKCDAQDLIKLSNCCNDVLSRLDDCRADDLACECCALQSMNQECYSLCSGNPSNNFLTVLYNDCASLSDVNACSLPFKKNDETPSKISEGMKSKSKAKQQESKEKSPNQYTLKSKLHNNGEDDETDASKLTLWAEGGVEGSAEEGDEDISGSFQDAQDEEDSDADSSSQEYEEVAPGSQNKEFTNATANVTFNNTGMY
ncbi:Piso0_003438 [Millerozyma farinosa CBS 7064]|uniref:Piso0_003438 protein n=1 Tax=Pichia sorbitophila (strain ATCC MYA-4447 / BCRC 22081 / CBS 7064 / NBRC 10061 / NRRL Y-12695) TaxID=559304 RepID=G8YI37_PICSO|nr:Piso0_003438 [Millerozyma farinosa CBS 7064]CCE81089.1 Piso0_003438 [Millerozyma farinosa CBS 7064]